MSKENDKDELATTMDTYKDLCLMVIIEGALTGDMDRLNNGMEALDLVERVNGYISDLTNTFDVLNDKLMKLMDTE